MKSLSHRDAVKAGVVLAVAGATEASADEANGVAEKLRAFANDLRKVHPHITAGEQWGRMIIADELDALLSSPATYKVDPITPGFRVRSMEQSWR